MSMLETAHKQSPNKSWWIKADALDFGKAGIRTSMKNEWSGDVDMGDGKLDKEHTKYVNRLQEIDGLTCSDLEDEKKKLIEDLPILQKG